MREEQAKLLTKAKDSLIVAGIILEQGYPGFAAARAYYAMFYAVEALLLSIDMSFSKHSAVISAFAINFVKPGVFPMEYHRYLLDGFKARMTGDYEALVEVTADDAEKHINRAREIVEAIEKRIEGDLK